MFVAARQQAQGVLVAHVDARAVRLAQAVVGQPLRVAQRDVQVVDAVRPVAGGVNHRLHAVLVPFAHRQAQGLLRLPEQSRPLVLLGRQVQAVALARVVLGDVHIAGALTGHGLRNARQERRGRIGVQPDGVGVDAHAARVEVAAHVDVFAARGNGLAVGARQIGPDLAAQHLGQVRPRGADLGGLARGERDGALDEHARVLHFPDHAHHKPACQGPIGLVVHGDVDMGRGPGLVEHLVRPGGDAHRARRGVQWPGRAAPNQQTGRDNAGASVCPAKPCASDHGSPLQ